MLTKRIIPCLDVKDGRVVKGTKFVNLRDAGDPVAVAEEYDRQQADEIVFLDITASHEERPILLEIVRKTAERVFMPLTVGGGVRSLLDIRALLNAGADKVAINTAAVHHPDLVKQASQRFGSQCIVVAIDAKRDGSCRGADLASAGRHAKRATGRKAAPRHPSHLAHWQVYTYGGRRPTGLDAIAWAKKMEAYGAGEILLTSMDQDGTKEGFDLALTRAVAKAVRIPVIASGGVGTAQHMLEGFTKGKADAALAASIFHFGELTVAQVKSYCRRHGVPMR